MVSRPQAHREFEDLQRIDTIELLWLCVADREIQPTWSELLRRILPRLKIIIRRALAQSGGTTAVSASRAFSGGLQESDLIQQVILRLVADDCELLRRFSGNTEDDLFAYLAVISRSVVRDSLRRQRALKRGAGRAAEHQTDEAESSRAISDYPGSDPPIERRLLARELADIGARVLEDQPPHCALRDKLIFQLYFCHDLTMDEIARCRGINLSKAGVDRVLNRLKERIKALANANRSEVVSR